METPPVGLEQVAKACLHLFHVLAPSDIRTGFASVHTQLGMKAIGQLQVREEKSERPAISGPKQ